MTGFLKKSLKKTSQEITRLIEEAEGWEY